jgi:ribulose-phosphate 3-epimerase
MAAPVRIAPSILSADFGRLAEEVRGIEAAGADWVHVDVMDGRFVPNITFGPGVVAAVRRATGLPIDVHLMIVEESIRYVLGDLDLILVMSVNPGFGGQQFLPEVLPKLRAIRALIDSAGLRIDLEVDGGIGPDTARSVIDAGATVLVAGQAVFGQTDRKAAIASLRDPRA